MRKLNTSISFAIFNTKNIYTEDKPIAEGGFGSIYKAKYCSVTIVKKEMKKLDIKAFLQEIITTHIYRSTRSTTVLGMCEDVLLKKDNEKKQISNPSIILEYIRGGDLRHKLDNLNQTLIKLPSIKIRYLIYVLELAKGLDFIHSKKLIHFDLKPENILIQDFDIKLIDFGISKEIKNDTSTRTFRSGTKRYEPPENNEVDLDDLMKTETNTKMKKKVSTAFDVWSYGIILNEIFGSEKPYGEKNTKRGSTSCTAWAWRGRMCRCLLTAARWPGCTA